MDPEVESELRKVIDRLRGQHESDIPHEFEAIAETTSAPALEEIASRMKASGYDCQVKADVHGPVEEHGQSVCLFLDGRYSAGAHPLCFRLTPGEALVRMETPTAGSTMATQRVPMAQITKDHVQRIAIDFLKHLV